MRKIKLTYGRGIARKAERTKKCCCNNPEWGRWQLEVNDRTDEITYTLTCSNCNALWSTKSQDARTYWKDEMEKRPHRWECFVNDEEKSVSEMFLELDMNRLHYLEAVAKSCDNAVEDAKREAEKAHRAIDRFLALIEGRNNENS